MGAGEILLFIVLPAALAIAAVAVLRNLAGIRGTPPETETEREASRSGDRIDVSNSNHHGP